MYETHFNLTDKPFKLTPDPKLFFSSPHHEKAASYLQYGLSQGEGFIVITGPIGTGKTTIARHLISNLDHDIVGIQIATTKLSPDELVKLVASKFNIETENLSKADILTRLERFLIKLNKQGKRALLLVDEAQNLPIETVEELRMLSNFQLDDKPLIQSFLLGQEELKTIIAHPQMEQFRQRIIASCHLKAFTIEQTKDYILHRLTQVGWQHYPKLEEDIYQQIHRYCKGIPRKINILADRLFLYAFLEDINTLSGGDVEQVIEELKNELSANKNTFNHKATEEPVQNEEGNQQLMEMQYTLQKVAEIMEQVIERKLATIHHLDKVIQQKQKAANLPSTKLAHLESVIDEKMPSNLSKKRWYKELMAKQ